VHRPRQRPGRHTALPAGARDDFGDLAGRRCCRAAGQGIAAGQFDEFLRALRTGTAYVNVHTNLYQGGEIRGNIDGGHQDHDDDDDDD
jgi:hypothetical protein